MVTNSAKGNGHDPKISNQGNHPAVRLDLASYEEQENKYITNILTI